LRYTALALGLELDFPHTCALTSAGSAYCWGNNVAGALGTGSTTNSTMPVAVSGGLSFTALAAGTNHTCGLTSDGAAYCWGSNNHGQLGTGSTTDSFTPVAVSGGLNFTALAAGSYHTCGLTSAGAAYCWGENADGQLGTGSTEPTQSSTPVAVSGGLSFTSLAAGGDQPEGNPMGHTCGLTGSVAAYCWGDNRGGQLGTGSITASATPVAVSGGLSFTALAAGGAYGGYT
jgi:hypothetical protein